MRMYPDAVNARRYRPPASSALKCTLLGKGASRIWHIGHYLLGYIPVLDDFIAFEAEKMNLPQPSIAGFRFGVQNFSMRCNQVAVNKDIPDEKSRFHVLCI